jgi:hypothetical protein
MRTPRAQIRRWFYGLRRAEAPFRHPGRAYGSPREIASFSLQHRRREGKGCAFGYCFASGAAKTCRHAAGNCASVIGGFGFGGIFGGFGCSTESLNQ